MPRSRQVVLVRVAEAGWGEPASASGGVPIGTYREVLAMVSEFNISPDGAPDSIGLLYGPGMTLQLPMVGPDDPVMQVLVSLDEEEIAWAVLARLCPALRLKMMDPISGRMFG